MGCCNLDPLSWGRVAPLLAKETWAEQVLESGDTSPTQVVAGAKGRESPSIATDPLHRMMKFFEAPLW